MYQAQKYSTSGRRWIPVGSPQLKSELAARSLGTHLSHHAEWSIYSVRSSAFRALSHWVGKPLKATNGVRYRVVALSTTPLESR